MLQLPIIVRLTSGPVKNQFGRIVGTVPALHIVLIPWWGRRKGVWSVFLLPPFWLVDSGTSWGYITTKGITKQYITTAQET